MRFPVRVSFAVFAVSAVLGVALVPGAATVQAASPSVIQVSTTEDAIRDDGRCSLREAIRSANLDRPIGGCRTGKGVDTILVPAGRYVLAIDGQDENAALTGDLDITSGLTIRGASAAASVIDANGLDRIFQIHPGARVTLDRLVITGGTTSPHDMRTPRNAGGGISNYGNLTLTSSLVTGNTTGQSGEGGGIFNSGMITVRDSWITDNWADAGGGLMSSGSAYLVRTRVLDNTSEGFDSHPPYVRDPSSTDTRPMAGDAGGITSSGYLSVADSLVAGNGGNNEWGHGGIAMEGGIISNSTIRDNGGEICGTGGISMINTRLIGSTVSGNSNGNCGPAAGGVYAVDSEIINSTISGNHTGGGYAVGGIRSERSTIVNSTITLNSSKEQWPGQPASYHGPGGLEAAEGTTIVRNTIIAGNVGGTGWPTVTLVPDCTGTITSGGHNLIGDVAGCAFAALKSDLTNVASKLGPLANNGGPTMTHTLLPGSPAIDAWYDGSVGSGATCPALDQRGVHRPQDGNGDGLSRCDIGALERT